MIQPLGETGYFLYHEEDRFHTGHHKVYLINTKRKCVDSIIISKETWIPVVDQKNPSVFYLVNGTTQKRIEFDLFSKKKEPGALPLHLIFINYFIPMPGKFCSTYDIDESQVTIYENFKAFRASKVLGKIQLQMCYSPFIDILYKQSKEADPEKAFDIQDLEGKSQLQLGDYVKNIQSMLELMSYNVLYGVSLLDFILRD